MGWRIGRTILGDRSLFTKPDEGRGACGSKWRIDKALATTADGAECVVPLRQASRFPQQGQHTAGGRGVGTAPAHSGFAPIGRDSRAERPRPGDLRAMGAQGRADCSFATPSALALSRCGEAKTADLTFVPCASTPALSRVYSVNRKEGMYRVVEAEVPGSSHARNRKLGRPAPLQKLHSTG